MPQFKTLQFANTPEGQSLKIRALEREAALGWRVVSETIVPGKFRGSQACCLFMIFAPCAFLAGHSADVINVTLELPDKAPTFDRQKWDALLMYDKDVASAAESIRPLGPKWVDELAAAYMPLADIKYLPAIVESVAERAKQEQAANASEMARQAELRAVAEREHERVIAEKKARLDRIYSALWGTNLKRACTIVGTIAAVTILVLGLWQLGSRISLNSNPPTTENFAGPDTTDPIEITRAYFTAWSSPSDSNGDAIRPFYFEKVVYFGRHVTINTVMAEKHAFAQRWPSRHYVLRPGTTRVSCKRNGDCKVVGVVDWVAENPSTGRHSAGSATFQMTVANGKIVGESSAVVSRTRGRH